MVDMSPPAGTWDVYSASDPALCVCRNCGRQDHLEQALLDRIRRIAATVPRRLWRCAECVTVMVPARKARK